MTGEEVSIFAEYIQLLYEMKKKRMEVSGV